MTPTPPVISSLLPTSGPVGTTLTINGSSFGDQQLSGHVRIGGVPAVVLSWSDSSIQVMIPKTPLPELHHDDKDKHVALEPTDPHPVDVLVSVVNGQSKALAFNLTLHAVPVTAANTAAAIPPTK